MVDKKISELTALGTKPADTDLIPLVDTDAGETKSVLFSNFGHLNLTGGTMSGNIAMGTNKLTGVGDPTAAQDAATKNYVDTTGFLTVAKTSNESTTEDTTLSDDAELSFSVSANKTYFVMIFIKHKSGVTPDFKWALSVPSGTTAHGLVNNANINAATSNLVADLTADRTWQTSNVNLLNCQMGIITVSSTAGTVDFQWAQNTSDAGATIVQAGSVIIYKEL